MLFIPSQQQLLIEAESNNKGFIAIDDISLTEGLCSGADVFSLSLLLIK